MKAIIIQETEKETIVRKTKEAKKILMDAAVELDMILDRAELDQELTNKQLALLHLLGVIKL